jgi:hypothetical protein
MAEIFGCSFHSCYSRRFLIFQIILFVEKHMKVSDGDFAIIESLDLEPIKAKLMHLKSGEGWSLETADAVEIEYRRFLYLMKKFPNDCAAPRFDVDIFWHYHILDTMKYAQDCQAVFGYFLHHFPYLGLRGEDDMVVHQRAGEHMRELYEASFGESYGKEPASPGAAQIAFSVRAPETMTTTKTAFSVRAPETMTTPRTAFSVRTPETMTIPKTAFSVRVQAPALAAEPVAAATAFSVRAPAPVFHAAVAEPSPAHGQSAYFTERPRPDRDIAPQNLP